MGSKPLAALPSAADPLLDTLARAPAGAPESDDERAAVKTAMVEADLGVAAIDHAEVVRKLVASQR